MADNEIKTLGEIKKALQEANDRAKEANAYLERADKKFTPAQIAAMSSGQQKALADLKSGVQNDLKAQTDAIDKLNIEKSIQEGFFNSLSKFLGVDFVSETFRRLDKVSQGFGEIKKGFQDLGKALGLNKVAKAAGGFWDFLKKLLAVGLVTIGFIKFLEGWNKADEIFGKAAGFGERLSAGLATVIGSFMGLTDGEINTLAKDINGTVQAIMTFLKTEFDALTTALKAAWPGIKQTFNGFVKLLEGDFIGGIKDISVGITNVGTELWNSESMLAKAVVVLAGVKLAGAALSFVTAIGPIFTALSTIGSGIATIFTALGGKAAFAAAMAAIGPALGSILIPLGLALAVVALLKSGFDGISAGMDEFDKTGDFSQAFSVGLGGFVKSLLNILTLGLLSDETLQSVQDNIAKFLDPIFEGIAGLFKSIWSWVKDAWDDVTFNIKDFLGMELSQSERIKKAEKDIAEAETNLAERQIADMSYAPNRRKLKTAKDQLSEAQSKLANLANRNVADNKILQSGVSSYDGYLKAVSNNQDLTQGQRMEEMAQANLARNKGQSFQNFQTSQITQNNAIIQKIRPQTPLGAN
jgi:hypothetical protein